MTTRRFPPARIWPGFLACIAAACLAPVTGCGHERPEASKEGGLPDVQIDDVKEEHFTDPVAVVNGVLIYRATYEEILTFLRDQIETGSKGSVEKYLRARDDALERAIDMELLFQEAVRRGYDLDPEELRTEYARRVAKGGSEEAYLAGARGHFLTKSEVLVGIRRELAVAKYLKETIESRISVTDAEVREYYEKHPGAFTTERSVNLGSIFVDAPQGSSRDARASALTRISQALERLKHGEPFEKVAKEISQDGVAHLGGRLGVVKRESLPEPLDEAAFSLNEGEISGILESEDGYHLLRIYEKIGGDAEPFEKVAEEARSLLLTRRKNQKMIGVVGELHRTATIVRQLTPIPKPDEAPSAR